MFLLFAVGKILVFIMPKINYAANNFHPFYIIFYFQMRQNTFTVLWVMLIQIIESYKGLNSIYTKNGV